MLSSEHGKKPSRDVACILDHDLLFAESFACLLKSLRIFDTVILSRNLETLWNELTGGQITHLFIDYHLPSLAVADTLQRVNENHPDVKSIVIRTDQHVVIIQRLMQHGARALISPYASLDELLQCLRMIEIGRIYLSPDLNALLQEYGNINHAVQFTEKEIRILQYIANGHTILATASSLHISKHTVIAHRRNMMRKSGMPSAAALVRFGLQAGLLTG